MRTPHPTVASTIRASRRWSFHRSTACARKKLPRNRNALLTDTHTHTHIHTHIYIYIYTYIHTHARMSLECTFPLCPPPHTNSVTDRGNARTSAREYSEVVSRILAFVPVIQVRTCSSVRRDDAQCRLKNEWKERRRWQRQDFCTPP